MVTKFRFNFHNQKKKMLILLITFLAVNLFSDYLIQQFENSHADFNKLFGQSFTTLEEGLITEIAVTSYGSTNTTLRFFFGESINTTDEIYTQQVVFSGSGIRYIPLDYPIEVTASTIYSFTLDQASVRFSGSTNPYSGGKLIYDGSVYSDYDLYFKVRVIDLPTGAGPLPVIDDLTISVADGNVELDWSYSTVCDSYKIYKSTDPFDFTDAEIAVTSTNSYSELVTNVNYFYRVTAIRN
jgi:hypothetical protein